MQRGRRPWSHAHGLPHIFRMHACTRSNPTLPTLCLVPCATLPRRRPSSPPRPAGSGDCAVRAFRPGHRARRAAGAHPQECDQRPHLRAFPADGLAPFHPRRHLHRLDDFLLPCETGEKGGATSPAPNACLYVPPAPSAQEGIFGRKEDSIVCTATTTWQGRSGAVLGRMG